MLIIKHIDPIKHVTQIRLWLHSIMGECPKPAWSDVCRVKRD